MANVLLMGLDDHTAVQIIQVLRINGHRISRASTKPAQEDLINADFIFADTGDQHYLNVLRLIRDENPVMPFVVVLRDFNSGDWLDAIEAGATDYLAMPVVTRELLWVMESAEQQTASMAA